MYLRACVAVALGLGAVLVALPWTAQGDELDTGMLSARAIGRAGAAIVSEDTGAALLVNPGGLVRRSNLRVQVGAAFRDQDSSFRAAGRPASPVITNRAPLAAAPLVSAQAGFGRLVIGASYLQTGRVAKTLATPLPNQPGDEVTRLFPHRYGGTAVSYERNTWLVGVAARVGSWLGVGLSAGLSQVSLGETRQVWAGFTGRGDVIGDPRFDLALTMAGRDRLIPTVNTGVLVAPPELPLELAVSATYSAAAHLTGDAALTRTRDDPFPAPQDSSPRSALTLDSPLVIRAGVRYLGRRLFIETSGVITVYTHTDPTWQLQGVAAVDETMVIGSIAQPRSLLDYRTHGAVRASVDYELVPGFLWLTGGYGYRMRGASTRRMSPGYAPLSGHTVAAGAEGQWGDITLAIGYSRTMSLAQTIAETDVLIINPFDGGTDVASSGSFDSGLDVFGASLELSWN